MALRGRIAGALVAVLASATAVVAPVHADTNETAVGEPAASWLSTGPQHTCVILDGGVLTCFGENSVGQLGLGVTTRLVGDDDSEVGAATRLVDLGTGRSARSVSVGLDHTCAIRDDRSVVCWGNGLYGALGVPDDLLGVDAAIGDSPAEMGDALRPVDLGRPAVSLSAGVQFTCAVLDDASVKCWGRNDSGQLGQGDTRPRGTKASDLGAALRPVDLGRGARAVAAGDDHVCALLVNGWVKCWGGNQRGELGQGDTQPRGDQPGEFVSGVPPISLGSPGRRATQISATGDQSCVVLDTDRVACWGAVTTLPSGGIGDQPGEMGTNLPRLPLSSSVPPAAVSGGGVCVLMQHGVIECDTPFTRLSDVVAISTRGARCFASSNRTVACDAPGSFDSAALGGGSVSCAPDGCPLTLMRLPRPFGLSQRSPALRIRPDLVGRVGTSGTIGDNVYDRSGTLRGPVGRLGTATYTLRVQNDGIAPESFLVKSRASGARFDISYSRGSTSLTTDITGLGWRTPVLAPGASVEFTVVVRAKAGASVGAAMEFDVRVKSLIDEFQRDRITLLTPRV